MSAVEDQDLLLFQWQVVYNKQNRISFSCFNERERQLRFQALFNKHLFS